ncbi:spore protease YyaC [Paenibacillus sp. 1P07SE]|uniref:spore protease YyaC n=1 Tax=Paenibacillus sp. 1P07SE TaxID=3132209 RepID=UPI0039A424D4
MRRTAAKAGPAHTGLFIPEAERKLAALRKREKVDSTGLLRFLKGIAGEQPDRERIAFLCIGSDRSTGDALGPLVGDLLLGRGWPQVSGTLAVPCDAGSLAEMTAALPKGCTVIAVDACLGRPESIGSFLVSDGPLRPAQAIEGTVLPDVGHYSIAAVVNLQSAKPYHTLQTTSLHAVMLMARTLADAICDAWPQSSNLEE